MTNEEKAKLEYPVTQARDVGFYCDVYDKERRIFIKACEWKDQQFKEYLRKKLGKYAGGELVYAGVFIKDIINELFEKTENVDHSNNDE